MDKLEAMRTFVAIADAGSLTRAARAQGRSLPAVVRSLAALEAELGVRLFHRTTRRIALTDSGRRYLARCREAQALVDEAEAELRAEQSEPQGNLIVTAPVLFGERHVAAGVTAYVERYPKVSVQLQLLDRVVNLLEEGIDVGIRIGPLEDSSLIAQAVGSMRRLTVAAPSYLSRRGVPQHPRELLSHESVRFSGTGTPPWMFLADGKALPVPVKSRFSVNQSTTAAEACAAGLGIGMFFAYQVAPYLARGALQVILADFETPPRPIHVVYPEARLLPARSRVFIEAIKRHILAEQSAWQPSEPNPPRPRTASRRKS